MLWEFAGFDHILEDCRDIIDIYVFSETIFVNKGEGEAIYGGKNIGIFVDYMAKRSAVGPFFGFAVAGGDVAEDDTRFVHRSIDGVDDVNCSFQITIVINCNSANVSVREEGTSPYNLSVHC